MSWKKELCDISEEVVDMPQEMKVILFHWDFLSMQTESSLPI